MRRIPLRQFPIKERRESAFTEAKKFFAENPEETKFSPRKIDPNTLVQNSFIKVGDQIYMMARTYNDTEYYLGKGSYANAKIVIDEHDNKFAVRIESNPDNRLPPDEISMETKIGMETGLVKSSTKRQSSSIKHTGTHSLQPGVHTKEYQIQKLAGQALNHFMKSQKKLLTDMQRFRIAIRTVAEIAKLHQKNIAHLDIKPENLLIDPETHAITAIDFAFSEKNITDDFYFTKGSPSYLAPKYPAITPSKKEIDLVGLIRTLFFPRLGKNEAIQAFYQGNKIINKNIEIYMNETSILNMDDINTESTNTKNFFYTPIINLNPSQDEINILLENEFESAHALGIEMICTKHDITIDFSSDATDVTRINVLDLYDNLISDAIQKNKVLTREKIKEAFDTIPGVTVVPNILIMNSFSKAIKDEASKIESKGFFARLFSKEAAKFSKNYATMLNMLDTQGNEFKQLVIADALLSSTNATILQQVVSEKMGFLIKQEAKDYVESRIKDEIAKSNPAQAIVDRKFSELNTTITQIITKQMEKALDRKAFSIIISELQRFEDTIKTSTTRLSHGH